MLKKLFVCCSVIWGSSLLGMDQQPKPATYPSSQLWPMLEFELVERPKVKRTLPSLLIVDVTNKPIKLGNEKRKHSPISPNNFKNSSHTDKVLINQIFSLLKRRPTLSSLKTSKPRSYSESAKPSSSNEIDILMMPSSQNTPSLLSPPKSAPYFGDLSSSDEDDGESGEDKDQFDDILH